MATKTPGTEKAGGSQDFTLISHFTNGYRNREDVTVLPPGVMIKGSTNVLTNTFQRIGIRKGYTLDGQADSSISGIKSSFDWQTSKGFARNMRAGFLTFLGNDGKLQYRYVDANKNVTWRDLMTSLTSVDLNFTTFWDFSTELITLLLWVDGSSNIYEWSGGITTFASATATTLTKQGTDTWGATGFYLAGTRAITIGGVSATYTGGEGTTTLTGVSVDFSATAVGSVIHQTPRTHANSASSGGSLPSAFKNSLISNLYNQIYIGSLVNGSVYVSKVNSFTDYAFSTPRVVGEGAIITTTSPPTALIPQESSMYITAGKDEWYETTFTLDATNAKETLDINRLNTTARQAAQSQAATNKIANSVVFLSFEPIIQTFGRISNVVLTPQMTDISFPIVNDMNAYDFSNASIFYFQKFVYVTVPAEGIVLIYNLTDPKNPYWEAPQNMPISRFAIIDGILYGHSSQVSETYKMFDGTNDNGTAISAVAQFSFNNYGTRTQTKGFNELYIEGYITHDTVLNVGVQYDIDGCATSTFYAVEGNDSQIVCLGAGQDNSLGKWSLGKQPLGGIIQPGEEILPPKFRVIKTMPIRYFYEEQTKFFTQELDYSWEIIAFGVQLIPYGSLNSSITQ